MGGSPRPTFVGRDVISCFLILIRVRDLALFHLFEGFHTFRFVHLLGSNDQVQDNRPETFQTIENDEEPSQYIRCCRINQRNQWTQQPTDTLRDTRG